MTPEIARQILKGVKFPEYTFEIVEREGRAFLRAWYWDKDTVTGKREKQYTRKWDVPAYIEKSELVQTAFKCIVTSMEHRAREGFTYNGEAILNPHFNCDDLWKLAHKASAKARKAAGL